MKYWWIGAIFIAVAAWMVFAARSPGGGDGLYSIQDNNQYNEVLSKVRDLTQTPIYNFDSGIKLTTSQIEDLKSGEGLIKKLIAYAPNNFGPYVTLAKTQRALGEADESIRNYKQALDLAPEDSPNPDVAMVVAEVKYDLATYYYEQSQYDKADKLVDEAIKAVPSNPKYLSTSAAIKSQLGKPNEARRLVNLALSLDPNDPTAIQVDAELKKINR